MRYLLFTCCALTIGCSQFTDLISQDAKIPEPLGIHVHPVQTTAAEIEEVCDVTGRIRMEAPADVVSTVLERIRNAPDDCRFLIVVEETLPLFFWETLKSEEKVDSVQIGNEPNNCQPGFACWDAIQTELWLRVNVPLIREAVPDKTIVCPAATPLFSDPVAMSFYAKLVDSGVLNLCDVQAVHMYGRPWTSPEKWASLTDEVTLLQRAGLPVWVTEYGVVEDSEEIEYAARIPFLFEARGMEIERFYFYAWNDETLGFSLRTGPSPLWRELR